MKRRIFGAVLLVAVLSEGFFTFRSSLPAQFDPNPEWEASVSMPGPEREKFLVDNDGIQLEAEVIAPSGGEEVKPAVIFIPGSGSTIYQNYAPGVLETFVQDIFLPRDVAVIYFNKRGMGESGGNWMRNDFQGRAEDVHAIFDYASELPGIDKNRIGLVGHSQGGWIAALAAAQEPDYAFFVSLAGPATSVVEQMEDIYENDFRCQGYSGEELQKRVSRQLWLAKTGASIGKVIPIGVIGFDAGIIDYDPRDSLQQVKIPGLMVFGTHDPYVPADQNVERFQAIFPEGSGYIQNYVVKDGDHHFRLTESVCQPYEERLKEPFSDDLQNKLNDWLNQLGNSAE